VVKLNASFKNLLVILGWSIIVASIILQRLYQGPLLLAQDYFIVFVASILAAMIIVDAKTIILGWMGSTLISISIMLVCLSLPGIVDEVSTNFVLEFLYAGAIVMIFRAIFPVTIILIFIGAIIGGIIGERIQ
jgi:hypothetical protein